ncbi:cytochrome C [Ramlibacter terrae]|uniref:Cytochrome C n=1 Tax=Ramlibacter terrae TaxID=2732511 RepID=A0ABX6P4Y1_9BURK|nr:cytochrome C [Ramlibacter terrae]
MRSLCVLALAAAMLAAGCEREARQFSSTVTNTQPQEAARQSANQPAVALGGGAKQAAANVSAYDGNAFAVGRGKRLYRWYNCNGCHANGGGSMGPALMDTQWRYGSEPADIFTSIMQGRPQGMPSFSGHIPEDRAWQIVAYVRSIGGLLPKDVAPSRSDSMSPGQPENARPRQEPQREGRP